MEWRQLFLEKEKWQRNTFNRIKNDLICAQGNRFLRYEESKEDHLVIIYGKPQVGKTTLILSMIGLKDEFFGEVYETLRAGITRGNSSTSTAIIYSRSGNDRYGCVLAPLDDIQSKGMYYCDKEGIIEELVKIRRDVENNRINSSSILFISIPNNFFKQDESKENISIMDMPGVGSRNHKEDIHLQHLLARYIPISSVCIIVCRANDIVSLETVSLPNNVDWKRLDHRFILAITNAYSDGTTRSYFKKARLEREKGFYEYVKDEYTNEIRDILGRSNKTEIYPLDIGDTLERLCRDEISDEDDRKEIRDTKNQILADLHDSIITHKGEKLKSALMDLASMAEHYREDDARSIVQGISVRQEKIGLLEKQRMSTCKNLKEIFPEIEENSAFEENCESEKEKIKEQMLENAKRCGRCQAELINSVDGFCDKVIDFIYKNNLCGYDGTGVILTDNNKQMLTFIHKELVDRVVRFDHRMCEIMEEAGIDVPDDSASVSKIYEECVLPYQTILYPPRKGFFSPKRVVSLDKVNDTCYRIQQDICSTLMKYINICIERLRDKSKELEHLSQMASTELGKLKKFPEDKKRYEQEIEDLNKELEDISIKKAQDKKTLDMYLKYAKEAYLEQRDQTVQKINARASADEKMMLVLLLGLLDKDYQKVIGGFDEGRG